MNFEQSFEDKWLEIDSLGAEKKCDKISLIKRSNLLRNLGRLTFNKSVEL